jgi:hypothetical protein
MLIVLSPPFSENRRSDTGGSASHHHHAKGGGRLIESLRSDPHPHTVKISAPPHDILQLLKSHYHAILHTYMLQIHLLNL